MERWHTMSKLERNSAGRAVTINRIVDRLKNDEHLMRLLHYPHKDKDGNYQDVLDEGFDDIVGSKDHGRIVRDHIIKTIQKDDIVSAKDCFILIHLGKRRPVFGNHLLARQEILIDVVVHNDYQDEDYRLDDICDRLDYLIVHERFGLGKVDISTPIPFEAPTGYYRFQMKYILWDSKK